MNTADTQWKFKCDVCKRSNNNNSGSSSSKTIKTAKISWLLPNWTNECAMFPVKYIVLLVFLFEQSMSKDVEQTILTEAYGFNAIDFFSLSLSSVDMNWTKLNPKLSNFCTENPENLNDKKKNYMISIQFTSGSAKQRWKYTVMNWRHTVYSPYAMEKKWLIFHTHLYKQGSSLSGIHA